MSEAALDTVENPGSLNDFARERAGLSQEEILKLYDGALARFRRSVRPDLGPPLHGMIDYLPQEVIPE